jgi:hypothetical protein
MVADRRAQPSPRGTTAPLSRMTLLAAAAACASVAVCSSGDGSAAGKSYYRAFSCDTGNVTMGGNVFTAVSVPVIASSKHSGCPAGGKGVGANPLGPCFTSPAAAKAELDRLPAGARAISLEGNSMYYLEDANASAARWGGSGPRYYMDVLPGTAGVSGPWADVYRREIKSRFTVWFQELRRLGGDVDYVLSDFEMGGKSASFNWINQPTKDGSSPVDALLADPRWPALQSELNQAGLPYGVNFSAASVATMKEWTSRDWHMVVWSAVVKEKYVADLLNASVFEPIRASFPQVHFSNFAHSHHTDPSGLLRPSCRHQHALPLGEPSVSGAFLSCTRPVV